MKKKTPLSSKPTNTRPSVAVIMGSISDWSTMKEACDVLNSFGVSFEKKVISAHRTPDEMKDFASTARARGIQVIIAGAGGAAHLPGMTAAYTTLPVIGVPVATQHLQGVDSLYSIVQMPKGVPVASVAIGNAANAGYLALQILALSKPELAQKLEQFWEDQAKLVQSMNLRLAKEKNK